MSTETKTRADQTLEPMGRWERTQSLTAKLPPTMPALCMDGVREGPLVVTNTRGGVVKSPDELPADVIPYIETIPDPLS